MSKSKMKEVAQLLGVEIGEEFNIKDAVGTFILKESGLYDNESYLCTCNLNFLLSGVLEIEKHVLDKVEKEYLENVLRPFKDRVFYIEKRNNYNQQYLHIHLKTYEFIRLPNFEKNTMYKGMELNKEYTLKELGLFE